MKKLFVGNLAWKVTEDTLKPLFEAYGQVLSIKIITDQYTGKSKGFGFVEMADADSAEKAIKELNDKPLLDRNMRVSLAQERTERKDFRGGGERERYQGGNGGGSSRGGSSGSFRPRFSDGSR